MLKLATSPLRIAFGTTFCLGCAILLRIPSYGYYEIRQIESGTFQNGGYSLVDRLAGQELAVLNPDELETEAKLVRRKLSIIGWIGVACFVAVPCTLLQYHNGSTSGDDKP